MIFISIHILLASHSVIFLVVEILSLTQSSYLIDGIMTFQQDMGLEFPLKTLL